MSPIDSYRHLFGLTGRTYIVVAFLARMPLAMSQLGTLLLVSAATGSYGAGGFCAGALAVANAVGAPFWGARADRLGQRRVVAFQSLAGAAGLVAVLLVVNAGLPWGAAAVASAATGLLLPQIGPLARVRWRPITAETGARQHRLVDAAFSYEGAADEASFVLGPALIGLGVSIASPTAALGPRGSRPRGLRHVVRPARDGDRHPRRDVGQRRRGRPVADARPRRALRGPAARRHRLRLGADRHVGPRHGGRVPRRSPATSTPCSVSAASSPASPSRPCPRGSACRARLRWFAVGLLVLSAPLLLVGSLPALVPVLLVLGCTVAPYMITTFTLAERVTPPSRTGAAMTVLAAATGLGYALGAAAAGRLADWGGHTPAYAVTVVAGGVAVLVSWSCARVLSAAESPSHPSEHSVSQARD